MCTCLWHLTRRPPWRGELSIHPSIRPSIIDAAQAWDGQRRQECNACPKGSEGSVFFFFFCIPIAIAIEDRERRKEGKGGERRGFFFFVLLLFTFIAHGMVFILQSWRQDVANGAWAVKQLAQVAGDESGNPNHRRRRRRPQQHPEGPLSSASQRQPVASA